jgi:hypothetical protein
MPQRFIPSSFLLADAHVDRPTNGRRVQIQSVIAQHLAMITHEDDQHLLALTAAVQHLHDAADLLVNLIAHGPVGCPYQSVIIRAHIGKWKVVRDPIGAAMIDPLLLGLAVQLAWHIAEQREGVEPALVALEIFGRRIERVVWGVEVDRMEKVSVEKVSGTFSGRITRSPAAGPGAGL